MSQGLAEVARVSSAVLRKSVAGMTAVAAASVLCLVSAGAANADPYDCKISYPERWAAIAKCTNGTGEYRVVTQCDKSGGFDYESYGRWVRVGQPSEAHCNELHRANSAGVQVR